MNQAKNCGSGGEEGNFSELIKEETDDETEGAGTGEESENDEKSAIERDSENANTLVFAAPIDEKPESSENGNWNEQDGTKVATNEECNETNVEIVLHVIVDVVLDPIEDISGFGNVEVGEKLKPWLCRWKQ